MTKSLEMRPVERPPASTVNLNELFTSKIFKVPDYQRAYSWDRKNWEDLWNDIREGMDSRTPHFWGTITLRNTGATEYDSTSAQQFTVYEVVDGQQRITTLCLLILALARAGKEPLKANFVKSGGYYRVRLGSLNDEFFQAIVDDSYPLADCRSNGLLAECLDYFTINLKVMKKDIDHLVEYVQGFTFSLEFQISDENLAIKAFESLNDRGKPLTVLDKTKSFLMFHSSRYLKGELATLINDCLGNVFKNYDLIKEKGDVAKIDFIRNPRYRFSEGELLRFFYHYFAQYAVEKYKLMEFTGYNYFITTENVFEEFLKITCTKLKKAPTKLKSFIREFLENFSEFTDAFLRIVTRTLVDEHYQEMFCFLGISAAVYPLIVSLEKEGMLDDQLLYAIEALDLRVYKIRGTDPRAELYRDTIARIKIGRDPDSVYRGVTGFIEQFMRDAELPNYLNGNVYGNPATKYILWEYEKSISKKELKKADYEFFSVLEKEHVFPETPTIGFPAHGFEEESVYVNNIHRLGNLFLLEGPLNRKAQNKSLEQKAETYAESKVPSTRQFSCEVKGFNKESVDDRTRKIIKFALKRWAYKP